jgi:hypothetical protein
MISWLSRRERTSEPAAEATEFEYHVAHAENEARETKARLELEEMERAPRACRRRTMKLINLKSKPHEILRLAARK